MAKQRKKRKFDAGATVREMARERIGQPKPTAVLIDKREVKRDKALRREMREIVL